MDLYALKLFLAVAHERSFSRAAAKVHRTQPAVSQAVRRLEVDLGEQLFDRSSKSGTLTDAGRVLQNYGQRLVRLAEETENAMRELRDLRRGRVLIGANEAAIHTLLPLMARFREKVPDIAIDVRRVPARQIAVEVQQPAGPELTLELHALRTLGDVKCLLRVGLPSPALGLDPRPLRVLVDAQQLHRLVEQRHVGHRPTSGLARAHQQGSLLDRERRRSRGEGSGVGEETREQLLRGQARPQPVEGGLDGRLLGREVTQKPQGPGFAPTFLVRPGEAEGTCCSLACVVQAISQPGRLAQQGGNTGLLREASHASGPSLLLERLGMTLGEAS